MAAGPDHLLDGSEQECDACDPKDGELCATAAKPLETVVEAARGSDVQIDLASCV